jgi:soluble lytic murein transglycosylase
MIAAAVPARADIIKYVDESGTLHFSNAGTAWPFEIYKREPKPKRPARYASSGMNHDKYMPWIYAAANTHGVDADLIKCVITVESDFNPQALSPKGAQGLMQLMPATALEYNVKNSFDPSDNIHGGTKFLKHLIGKFHGDLRLTLAAYNAGEEAVRKYSGIPPYQETMEYVEKILSLYGKPYESARYSEPGYSEKKKIYRYEREDGTVLLTDTPRKAGDFD